MNVIEAVVLGIVEGATEFLPVSSTAHLILAGQLLGIEQTEFVKFFQVFIQSGAILAVVALFWNSHVRTARWDVLGKVLVAFVPTALVGLIMHSTIKSVFFESNALIGWSLIGVGLLFGVIEMLVARRYIALKKRAEDMSYGGALLIGLIQSAAIIPGVSRAGAVMVGMMAMGYMRSEAALFSFMLAVPTILGAGALDSLAAFEMGLRVSDVTTLVIGTVVSGCVAYVLMRWLIGYLQKHTLYAFAVYRLLLGAWVVSALI